MEDTSVLPYKIDGIEIKEYKHIEYNINPSTNNYIIGAIKVVAKQSIFNFYKEKYHIDIQNYKTIIPKNIIVPTTCKFS